MQGGPQQHAFLESAYDKCLWNAILLELRNQKVYGKCSGVGEKLTSAYCNSASCRVWVLLPQQPLQSRTLMWVNYMWWNQCTANRDQLQRMDAIQAKVSTILSLLWINTLIPKKTAQVRMLSVTSVERKDISRAAVCQRKGKRKWKN